MKKRDFIRISVLSLLFIFLASTSLYAVVFDVGDQARGNGKKIKAEYKEAKRG